MRAGFTPMEPPTRFSTRTIRSLNVSCRACRIPRKLYFNMSSARQEWKVGLFVLLGLTLLGILMVQFSKSWTGFKPTYELKLKAFNVGGLKPQSSVLMAGIVVGQVLSTDLSPDGKSVLIRVRIFKRYAIYSDARILIEQSGFLGDQFVSIDPQKNQGSLLKDGDEVICQEPFNPVSYT